MTYPETLDYNGAHRLAMRIDAYWRKRGLDPHVRVEQLFQRFSPDAKESSYYVVRSNMVGGLPQ